MASLFSWLAAPPRHVDEFISAELDLASRAGFRVHTKELPAFRFVDLFRATDAHCLAGYDVRVLDSSHYEDLNSILHGRPSHRGARLIQGASVTAWPVGPDEEAYFPVERFWLCAPRDGGGRLIARLRYNAYTETSILEVAGDGMPTGEESIAAILAGSLEQSIYRNRILELAFESGTKDEFGDVEKPDRLRVLFRAPEPVDDADIVIDEEVRRTLWRNVGDLHARRAILKANRVPVRRGVLLYGPPGTGKTFACRYLCSKLTETTRLVVSGTALMNVGAIFNIARLLQPCVVFLEDVDLVYAARDINHLYGSMLGDLLDQMDGLRPFEDIGIVLTTNSIDRMEAAIKDRPGRVSQCIYFGPPDPALRRRYLERYLRSYDTGSVDLDRLVAETDGATQAFLKEWVHRAVQIGCERLEDTETPVALRGADFAEALAEMKRFSEGSTGRIIGFHAG